MRDKVESIQNPISELTEGIEYILSKYSKDYIFVLSSDIGSIIIGEKISKETFLSYYKLDWKLKKMMKENEEKFGKEKFLKAREVKDAEENRVIK